MTVQGLILVPFDGSDLAEKAAPVAVEVARRTGAALRLLHVHVPLPADPIYVEGLAVMDEHMRPVRRSHEQAYMEKALGRLPRGLDATMAILDGPVASALADHARTSGADLIVMTTHGRGGLERSWLGSVADELVRVSPVPLLLDRPEPSSVTGIFRRILVPLDGSALAEAILDHGIRFGRLEPGAEVILVDVVQPVTSDVWLSYAALSPSETVSVTHRQEQRARDYLEGITRRLEAAGVRARSHVVVAANVTAALLEMADTEQVDLVALATHGRSGLARLALGSVADKVIRGSRTPVLILRPPAAASGGGG
jgi:nucleotide-binding universal stress UspA family protein